MEGKNGAIARRLKQRHDEIRAGGMMAQMAQGPALLDELAAFVVDLADTVDALAEAVSGGAQCSR